MVRLGTDGPIPIARSDQRCIFAPFCCVMPLIRKPMPFSNGKKIHRWSLLAMGIGPSVPNLTMLVNVEVPENALSVYSDVVVRKALASVTFRPAPIQEQLGMLPFSLGDLSCFQVMQVMPTGTVFLAENLSDSNE